MLFLLLLVSLLLVVLWACNVSMKFSECFQMYFKCCQLCSQGSFLPSFVRHIFSYYTCVVLTCVVATWTPVSDKCRVYVIEPLCQTGCTHIVSWCSKVLWQCMYLAEYMQYSWTVQRTGFIVCYSVHIHVQVIHADVAVQFSHWWQSCRSENIGHTLFYE